MELRNFKHEYVCSSVRNLEDETDIIWRTDKEYKLGDWFIDSDGIKWYVEFICR